MSGRDENVVATDSSIILRVEVWVASGHVEVFHDPLVESLIAPSATAQTIIEASSSTDTFRPTGSPTSATRKPASRASGPSRAEFNMMLKTSWPGSKPTRGCAT